ncbi:MAG: chaperonin GroEL, partial [Polyangiaceae bacterium]|nr:chaperonin GroEL [Polyangiaceae bacterium]
GIVAGGGVAYLRAQSSLDNLPVSDEQQVGVQIIRRAIEEPMRQIAANAGEEGSIIVKTVRDGVGSFGYNAQTGEFGDLLEMGVIDPLKVVRTALENAASVAGLLLTTEALVAEKPKDDKDSAAPGGDY